MLTVRQCCFRTLGVVVAIFVLARATIFYAEDNGPKFLVARATLQLGEKTILPKAVRVSQFGGVPFSHTINRSFRTVIHVDERRPRAETSSISSVCNSAWRNFLVIFAVPTFEGNGCRLCCLDGKSCGVVGVATRTQPCSARYLLGVTYLHVENDQAEIVVGRQRSAVGLRFDVKTLN